MLFIILFSGICPGLNFTPKNELVPLKNIQILLNDFNDPAIAPNLGNIPVQENMFNIFRFIDLVYVLGILFFLYRFVNHLWFIVKIRNRSKIAIVNQTRVYQTHQNIAPFSFLRWIFISKYLSSEKIQEAIIAHEKVHVNQLHTIDLLFTEIICILSWFNPFVFLYKRSLKNTHEYLADSNVIRKHLTADEYLRRLSGHIENRVISGMASSFNFNNLKNRIEMITKHKKSKIRAISYLMLIPVIAILTLAFSADNPVINPEKKEVVTQNTPEISPIKQGEYKRISMSFGKRMHPIYKTEKMHTGMDFAADEGTPIMATADGKVIKAESRPETYGIYVVIQHNNTYSTFYSHMSKLNIKAEASVKKGDIIGYVGNTGLSTGSHLHYEVWKNEKKVNPEDYIK